MRSSETAMKLRSSSGGHRSLGAAPEDESSVLSQQGMHQNSGPLLVRRLQGTAALQVNVVFQGGMASAFAKASPFAKGFGGQVVGGHVRAVPNLISPNLRPYL
jgi:hypothetical protein